MSKTATPFDKFLKETSDFGNGYSDACAKSSTIFMKGFENIVSTMMSLAQESTDKQAKLMQEVMGIKNINEFASVQNKIAQQSFDDFVSGATKISEIGVKVLTESTEPVNDQINKAVQKATQSMAA